MNPGDAANGLFDQQAALKRLGGNLELLKDMFRFFVEDAPPLLETLDASLAKGDFEEAYQAVHSLKGLASNFDAHVVTGLAKQLEECLRKKDLDGARPLASKIRQGVTDSLAAGKAELNYPGASSVEETR